MRISSINNQYQQNFGINYKLSKETIKAVESSTGLSYEEMTRLSLEDSAKLMKERGKIKEPSKLNLWLRDKYREIGEKFGLLEKQYYIYTED